MTTVALTARQRSRLEFALGVLVTHRKSVDAAIAAIGTVELTREAAELVMQNLPAMQAEIVAAETARRSRELDNIRARLALDGNDEVAETTSTDAGSAQTT